MTDDTQETPTLADPTAEAGALRAKLEAAEAELNNYKLRLADFDNARKRLLRDAENERKYAAEAVLRDLLPALDTLDRALAAAKAANDAGPLATGVAATLAQALDALKRHGATRIECEPGAPFDPNRHQAVMEQPGTAFAPGSVVQVLQHGFVLHDRVLRPATVIVSC
jgi:molecular chaperone GrpE